MTPQFMNVGDHIQMALAECHPHFLKRSAPLFAVNNNDRPDLFATCVAIELNDRTFLVTAAHAIYEIESSGSAVHVGGKTIKPIPDQFTKTSEDGTDSLDVAFVEVENRFISSNGICVVPTSQLVVGRSFATPHLRCMHGYPLTKNKPVKTLNVSRKAVTPYAFTYAGAQKKNPNFQHPDRSDDSHIAISYQLGKNDKGIKVNPPSPKGMSGGGLWIVPNSMRPEQAYLGGILIEQHGKMVLATKIDKAIEFLQNNS